MGNHGSSNNQQALTDSGRLSINKSANAISENNTTQASSTNEVKESKIRTHFEWKEGGNAVYLVGSFSNWTQLLPMTKLDSKIFELYLVIHILTKNIPPGIYQFKFVVDNVWNFSKHHRTCNDGKGNINNIVDTTLIKKELSLSKDEDNPYPSIRPQRRDMHIQSENVPDSFKERYGCYKFICRYNNVNTSYTSCAIPPHVIM
jgi:hypothetical protein